MALVGRAVATLKPARGEMSYRTGGDPTPFFLMYDAIVRLSCALVNHSDGFIPGFCMCAQASLRIGTLQETLPWPGCVMRH